MSHNEVELPLFTIFNGETYSMGTAIIPADAIVNGEIDTSVMWPTRIKSGGGE